MKDSETEENNRS